MVPLRILFVNSHAKIWNKVIRTPHFGINQFKVWAQKDFLFLSKKSCAYSKLKGNRIENSPLLRSQISPEPTDVWWQWVLHWHALIYVRTKSHTWLMALFIRSLNFFFIILMHVYNWVRRHWMRTRAISVWWAGSSVFERLPTGLSLKFWMKVDGSLSVTIQQRRIQNNSAW